MIGSRVTAVKIHVMYTRSLTLILSDNLVTIKFFNLAVKWFTMQRPLTAYTENGTLYLYKQLWDSTMAICNYKGTNCSSTYRSTVHCF